MYDFNFFVEKHGEGTCLPSMAMQQRVWHGERAFDSLKPQPMDVSDCQACIALFLAHSGAFGCCITFLRASPALFGVPVHDS